jgi:photosystem II stability/assembly factor-like uncharacterized protein
MKIKNLFVIGSTLVILFIVGCDKDNDPVPPTPPTTDTLGIGWKKIATPSNSIYYNDVFFTNSLVGYICGDKYLAKSIDGGLTCTKFNLPDSLTGNFYNLFFLDANNGWVVSPNYIIKTSNGGINWQKNVNNPGINQISDVQFLSTTIGFLASMNGFFKSIDGGLNWTKTSNVLPPQGLFFFDGNTGWITYPGYFRKTENAGGAFTITKQLAIGVAQHIVQFTDPLHGWVTGIDGIIWGTTDGGNNWLNLGLGGGWGDLHFFNNNKGIALSNNRIYITSDGGTNWVRQAFIQESEISEIHYVDENHGWAAGSDGGLYRFLK